VYLEGGGITHRMEYGVGVFGINAREEREMGWGQSRKGKYCSGLHSASVHLCGGVMTQTRMKRKQEYS